MSPDDHSPSLQRADAVGRVARALRNEADVLAAYVFGSVARGTAGPTSDLDVAVLLGGVPTTARRLELIDAVAAAAGTDRVDVVVLDDAPPALAYRVLRDGQLLFSRDEPARIAHWVRTVDRYLDMEPMRRALSAGVSHRLEEGRFGRS